MKNSKTKKENYKEGWKIIFKYLLEYKREVIILSILGVISALANGSVPFIIGNFFDAILVNDVVFASSFFEMPAWLFLVLIFAFVRISSSIIDYFQKNFGLKVDLDLISKYKTRQINKLIDLGFSFHKNKKSGSLIESINRSTDAIDRIFYGVFISFTPHILSIIFGLVFVFFINMYFGLVLVLNLFLFTLILRFISPRISKLVDSGNRAWNKASYVLLEVVNNIFEIKRTSSEKKEKKRIKDVYFNKAARSWFVVEKFWNSLSLFQSISIVFTQLVVFIFSVSMVQSGSLTIGDLTALNGYALVVFGPFMMFADKWNTIIKGVTSVANTEKLLNTPPEIYHPKNATKLKEIKGNIEFKDVSFHYKKKEGNILNNINMEVKAGETVALVGESGVGKSTLINLISAYYFAQKGKVLIDGIDIRKIDLEFLRKNIAIVPQEVSLFNDTIKNNIRYGSFKAKDSEVTQAAKEAHADKFIDKFPKKYRQIVGERGVKLSVGQKQRVAIARAILRDPKILILDEPTSALDPKIEKLITESLDKLMEGRTTFIVAHRLSTVRKADKIFVFKAGEIIETGTHQELMNIDGGEYRKLYELHVGVE